MLYLGQNSVKKKLRRYMLCGGVAACHAATPPHNIQRRSFYRILT